MLVRKGGDRKKEWNGMEWNGMEWNGMEWNGIVQLKGTYSDHLMELPDHFRADQKLKQGIKGVVQRSLKH